MKSKRNTLLKQRKLTIQKDFILFRKKTVTGMLCSGQSLVVLTESKMLVHNVQTKHFIDT